MAAGRIQEYMEHFIDTLRDSADRFFTLHDKFFTWLTSVHPLAGSFGHSAEWLALCFIIFLPLARLFPNNPKQPVIRRDMVADMVYWFAGPVVYGPIGGYLFSLLINRIYSNYSATALVNRGLPPLSELPLFLQAFLILFATDFLQYWLHRMFHGSSLWKYHAIHHSSEHVDWMSSSRFHPVNIVLYSVSAYVIVALLGFSPAAFAVLVPFNIIYSPLVHANLNWTYGPFKYVLASPVFHRWHHTHTHQGGNKNFAPTFPVLDVVFGTFYMPKGELPEKFGVDDGSVPHDFFGQLFYPFKK